MREKWMKFFRSGFQRVLVDSDRALKNDLSDSLKAFISDQKLTFSDRQFIRALLILQRGTGDFKAIREKDRILNFLMNNILAGKFEFKKGNTLAALAEALSANFDSLFPGATKRTHYEVHNIIIPILGGSTDVMQTGSFSVPSDLYSKVLRVFAAKIIPFLRQHYFGNTDSLQAGGYHAHKKAVVVGFLYRMRIHDEALFSNFARHLGYVLNQTDNTKQVKGTYQQLEQIEKAVHQIVCTQDPITNNTINRLFEVVECLDFHA